MRSIITAVLATVLTMAAHHADAQTLVSADHPDYLIFTSGRNADWSLDGVGTTSLSFRTGKAQETVQLGFGGFCGAWQGAAGNGATTSGYIQIFFVVDGQVLGENGNANQLCNWNYAPANPDTFQGSAATAQQRLTIATPGIHTVSVLVQAPTLNNGANMWPLLGQTHLTVGK